MWILVALITVAGATSPKRPKECPVYEAPCEPVDCGSNAYWENCPPQCPPHQNCSLIWSKFQCIPDDDYCCKPACRCKDGFYRDKNFKCISGKQCTGQTDETEPEKPKPSKKCKGPNEEWVKCRQICPPQNCDISYTTYACPKYKKCESGCNCIRDYLRLKNGTCVKNDDCPTPGQTEEPEPEAQEQCGVNEGYARCVIACPTNYCPTSDVRAEVQCLMQHPCPSGCICEGNRLRKSRKDRTCILAKDCLPVECTRKNEEWDPCPSSCLAESCADVNKNEPCNVPYEYCRPQCVCKQGHYRNHNDMCVPASDCPPVCKMNETYVNCKAECPNNYCPVNDISVNIACDPPIPCPPGCACDLGYRRKSEEDKTCILAEECPPVECRRPNEVWNSCPSGCLAEYCGDVNNQPTECYELLHNCQPRCICAKGYFRNDYEICVPAKECKVDCGPNKTIVPCTFKCPHHFCPKDDSLEKYACKPPRDCPSGCGCKDGYRYKSSEDDTCVLAKDCPPVTCTRPHETWNACPRPCYSDTCEDRNKPQTECNEPEGQCDPRCVCKKGYYRNANKICVPACDCD